MPLQTVLCNSYIYDMIWNMIFKIRHTYIASLSAALLPLRNPKGAFALKVW